MIKELTINDFETVENIITQLHKIHVNNRPDFYKANQHPITKEEYKLMLNDKNKINITYIIDDKIVGICLATIKNKIERSIYIDDLFVIEPFRQQGIATKLYKHIEAIANDIGAKRIDLTVWQFNTTAIKFYKSLGMREQRIVLETRLE